MILSKPRLMRWNNNAITDHNRAELTIDTTRIEKSARMANGTLRKYVVADKLKFSTSWDMLPETAAKTVDGFWGANEMQNFYTSTVGSFPLELTYADGTIKTYTVMFTDFGKVLKKRGAFNMWALNVTMEEV